ncbi:MAG: hypothetical protein ABIJ59_19345 [Pseudomonadota bacterium]
MILDFNKSFAKDSKKSKIDKSLLERVQQVIQEVDIHGIRNLKTELMRNFSILKQQVKDTGVQNEA